MANKRLFDPEVKTGAISPQTFLIRPVCSVCRISVREFTDINTFQLKCLS